MLDCKLVDTLIVQNHHLAVHSNQVPTNRDRYQMLAMRLIYLSHTWPAITYIVSVVSQFMYSLSDTHIGAVERILRYLKSSLVRGIMFSKNVHCRIKGYTDADWTGNITDRRSTSGYFTFVGANLVTWRRKK